MMKVLCQSVDGVALTEVTEYILWAVMQREYNHSMLTLKSLLVK